MAIKIDDGNNSRAGEVAMAALIEALVPMQSEAERELLAALSNVALRNWRGVDVGRLAAHPSLRRLAPPANGTAA